MRLERGELDVRTQKTLEIIQSYQEMSGLEQKSQDQWFRRGLRQSRSASQYLYLNWGREDGC